MTAKTLLTLASVTALIYHVAYYVFPGTCTTVCCLHLHDRSNFVGTAMWADDGSFNPEQQRKAAYDAALEQVLARENADAATPDVDTDPGFFSGLIQTVEHKVHAIFSYAPAVDIALPLAEQVDDPAVAVAVAVAVDAPVSVVAAADPVAVAAIATELAAVPASVASIASDLVVIPDRVVGAAAIAGTVLFGDPATLI